MKDESQERLRGLLIVAVIALCFFGWHTFQFIRVTSINKNSSVDTLGLSKGLVYMTMDDASVAVHYLNRHLAGLRTN